MVIKFIDCTETYHKDMDKIIKFLSEYFDSLKIKNYRLNLCELNIAKCSQCRSCTQKKGSYPIKCVIKDELNDTLDEIEEADAYVILADRNNLFSKNKIHEKLSERLIAYHYWPFGKKHSTPRKLSLSKRSLLINLNTTKYFMNHSFYTSKVYMEQTSSSIGARVLDWLAVTPKEDLIEYYKERLKEMANNLVVSSVKRRET
jgi:hypothetical protein